MRRPQAVSFQRLGIEGTPEEQREVVGPPTVAGRHLFHGVWTFTGVATTLLPGSVSEVFAFLADPAHLMWRPSAKTLQRLPTGPIGVGTIFAAPSRWGRELLAPQETTLYYPNQCVERCLPPGTRAGKSPARSVCWRFTVHEAEEGTQVELTCTITIKHVFLKLLIALLLLLPYAALAFVLVLVFHLGEPTELDLSQVELGDWKASQIIKGMAAEELAQWKRAFESDRQTGPLP